MFLFTRPYMRQILAMTPAYLVMICGGMFLSYGVFNNFIGYQKWAGESSTPAITLVATCFHIAVIFGVIPVSLVYNKIDIFKIQSIASCLMLAASIILIILPQSYVGVLTSRTIFGLGFGSSYISSIIYASEISSPSVRAHIILMLHIFLTLGMFLFSIFSIWMNFTLVMQLTGSFTLALTIVSIALGFIVMKPSHIFMMQNNSKDSLERFQYFQRDSTENPHVEIETMQTYIIEEKKRRYNFFGTHNISALAAIVLIKLGYLSIFNALHNFYRAVYLNAFFTIGDISYTHSIMMGTRLCGSVAGFFLLDHITKRLQFFISAITISVLLFIFGILVVIYQSFSIWTPAIFFIPLEFFVGFGLSPIADILKGELFPLKEKPVSIAAAIAVEELVHIICIILLYSWILSLGSVPRVLTFIFGTIACLFGVVVVLSLKDSRKEPLRDVANLYSIK